MKLRLTLGIIAVSAALAATPAFAHKGGGEGHWHDGDRIEKRVKRHKKKHEHVREHRKEARRDHRRAHRKAERHARKHHHKHGNYWHSHKKHWKKHHRHDHHRHGHRARVHKYYRSNNDIDEVIAALIIGGVIGHVLTDNNVWEH